jgi:rhodanese-related sulfurtransferase
MGVEQLVSEARRKLTRLTPHEVDRALTTDAILIDIRSETQRAVDGTVPAARFVPRNVLEWRLDPSSPWRDSELARPDALVILMCDEGYQSSLAAATLKELGLSRATDLLGGFQAWRTAGLSVEPPPRGTLERTTTTPPSREVGPPAEALFRLHGH